MPQPAASFLFAANKPTTRRRMKMKKINLREVYPFYENDCFVMVDDEIAEIFEESKRKELNYQRKIYRNGAHFSLDRDDGIEHDAIFISLSPYEIYERKMTNQELHCAISKLPDIQAKRIYAYYFLDMNKSEIARAEGVSVKAVCNSINQGLQTLEKELKKFQK
jgi:RNA polymerase sigma-70 factor (ECF subfamily)